MAVVGPLGELDLGDELGLDPCDVPPADLRHLGDLAERRFLALERAQLCEQPLDLLTGEAGADVANVLELAASAHGQHERAKRPRTSTLSLRVAGDDELLAAVCLDL